MTSWKAPCVYIQNKEVRILLYGAIMKCKRVIVHIESGHTGTVTSLTLADDKFALRVENKDTDTDPWIHD